MRQKLLKALDFLRLLDENGVLSITNLAVILILIKITLAAQVNFAEMGALLTVISGYQFKHYFRRQYAQSKEPKIEVVTSLDKVKLDMLNNDVERLKLAAGFKNVASTSSQDFR